MKILVPVDGSSASVKAIETAIAIAKKEISTIKLINVIDDGILSSYSRNMRLWESTDAPVLGNQINPKAIQEEAFSNAEKTLKACMDSVDFSDIEVGSEIVIGTPYAEILDVAEKENIDLIVMGNRGYSRIRSFFLGSVAQRVISESKCPVLVVHSDTED